MTDLPQDDYYPPMDDWMGKDPRTGEPVPIFQPQNPRWPGWQKNTNWNWMARALRSEETKVVWVGPNLRWWDLAGNLKGRQGVVMINELLGVGLAPFEHKYSEGPYVPGATLERTDIKKRVINFGVIINPNANATHEGIRNRSTFQYRYLENLWWESWSKDKPGFLGFFTRATGWRWIKCILETDTNGSHSLDPVAYGNNGAKYDMSVVCVDPYFYKPPFSATWKNDPDKVELDGSGFGTGQITLANRGTVEASPLYIVTCPGQALIGDGPDRLIPMVETSAKDKYYMIDTSPNQRTITGAVDPVDNPFYRFIRQAGLINYFLHDLADEGLPLWRRWDNPQEFDYAAGPRSSITVTVKHDYPDAEITMIMPQRYEMAWG